MEPRELVALLLGRLVTKRAWPPESEKAAWATVRRRRAFLDNDREQLRKLASWDDARRYRVDPLAGTIATAWADHLFADDPTIVPGDDGDGDLLAAVLAGNPDLIEDLHRAAQIQTGEGEVWWRVFADADVADVSQLEWHSRDAIIPLWIGRKLAAAAIVSELQPLEATDGVKDAGVYRSLEVHTDGLTSTHLFRGTASTLGDEVPLLTHPDVAAIYDPDTDSGEWPHGLPMLVGRVRNPRGRDRRLGGSDLDPIQDQLLDLNEAATIGGENMRLTAKKRIIVPEQMLDPIGSASAADELQDNGDGTMSRISPTRPKFDAGEDVFVATELDKALGMDPGAQFKALEYSFDAAPLIAHKLDLVETALTRIGLTPQVVGVADSGSAGYAVSGIALRLKAIPSTRAGKGKGRAWDSELPKALQRMQQVDALDEDLGGFGRVWSSPDTAPAVERAAALPTDDVEAAAVETQLVGAGVRSRRTSLRTQHPEWTDEQIDTELAEIDADRPKSSGLAGFGLS